MHLTSTSAPFITSPRSGADDFVEREEIFFDFIMTKGGTFQNSHRSPAGQRKNYPAALTVT